MPAQEVGVQRDAIGAQDPPERQDQRGAGPGQVQRGRRALGPRPADVRVVEEKGARPGERAAISGARV